MLPWEQVYHYFFQLEDLHSYLKMSIVQMDARLFAATPGGNPILPIHAPFAASYRLSSFVGGFCLPQRLDSL